MTRYLSSHLQDDSSTPIAPAGFGSTNFPHFVMVMSWLCAPLWVVSKDREPNSTQELYKKLFCLFSTFSFPFARQHVVADCLNCVPNYISQQIEYVKPKPISRQNQKLKKFLQLARETTLRQWQSTDRLVNNKYIQDDVFPPSALESSSHTFSLTGRLLPPGRSCSAYLLARVGALAYCHIARVSEGRSRLLICDEKLIMDLILFKVKKQLRRERVCIAQLPT